ncbi:mannan endo-1,4-beta-mannosidase-like [Haliotis rufescens]|uniref:mannan endo-1,4-beta-mannosidase-like n=1 Tax=Haliotis rufescens TaxID=6454 RepID=UPI00201EDF12|nr:mannan endo-1,4-beta-mannosidase-like [Haliotis rufescens]
MKVFLLAVLCLSAHTVVCRLSISGDHFYEGSTRVFLSGVNAAWVYLGTDFGNNQLDSYRLSKYTDYIKQVQSNGGNSIRIFVHDNCETTPDIDSNGITQGPDKSGTLISDLKKILDVAETNNVLVFFALFNGAQKKTDHWKLQGIIADDNKRQKYIEMALQPMVKALGNHKALGGWDIMNEMEGIIKVEAHAGDSCFDTSFLLKSGAGFAGATYSAQDLQRFLNHLANGIKQADSAALITSGSWNPISNTDMFGSQNLYNDSCLRKAGGKQQGVLSFYSTHTYAKADTCQCHYDNISPFHGAGHHKSDYGLDKPLVIAEFSEKKGDGWTASQQFNHAYYYGYAGAWGWQYKQESSDADEDTAAVINAGLQFLKGKTDASNGGTVNFHL